MKRALALAIALSTVTSLSAYAVPKAAPAAQTAVASANSSHAVVSQAQPAIASKPVVVAENRREFGSQYQRY
ncbi:hypothetical protein [Pseudomonas sp. RIT-PI-S]|uniref:hypothetical protein n=1 Tax=Pseudomonas sp. RIT-PI-S TaxID=3035295 RepID=UPI0021D8A165|nr:hypothetical protein [Pseudomonas sp. RIT-PI-S]